LLLHPTDGHSQARSNPDLVREWCTLSASNFDLEDRKQNFNIALTTYAQGHRIYNCDLPVLLNLTMSVKEYDLALDLADEILRHRTYGNNSSVLSSTKDHLQAIAKIAVLDGWNIQILTKFLHILSNVANSNVPITRRVIDVPQQLLQLLQFCCTPKADTPGSPNNCHNLIHFLAQTASPSDTLTALANWEQQRNNTPITHDSNPKIVSASTIIQALQILLKRAAFHDFTKELSGSLLLLRYTREKENKVNDALSVLGRSFDDVAVSSGRTVLWRSLLNGTCAIDKL